MSYWYQYATTSNRLNRSYINGFVDISGGDLTLRNSNFNVNGLIAQNTSNILPVGDRGPASVTYSYVSWNDVSNNFVSSVTSGTLKGSLTVTNDLSVNGNLYVNSQSNHQITVTASSFQVTEDMSLNGRLYVSSDVSLNGRVNCLSDVSLNGRLYVGSDVSLNGRLYVGSDVSLGGRVNILSDLSVNKRIFVNGDASFNGNVVINNSLFYTPSGGTISANTVISQPLSTVYFVNPTANIQITLPIPTPATTGQVIHVRRTGGTTTTSITFVTNPANFVVANNVITLGSASIAGSQFTTKFISNGTNWYQVYLQ